MEEPFLLGDWEERKKSPGKQGIEEFGYINQSDLFTIGSWREGNQFVVGARGHLINDQIDQRKDHEACQHDDQKQPFIGHIQTAQNPGEHRVGKQNVNESYTKR